MNEVARGFYFVRVSFGLESCLEFASEKCHFVSKGVVLSGVQICCLVLWAIVKLNYFCHDCAVCLCAIFHVALL